MYVHLIPKEHCLTCQMIWCVLWLKCICDISLRSFTLLCACVHACTHVCVFVCICVFESSLSKQMGKYFKDALLCELFLSFFLFSLPPFFFFFLNNMPVSSGVPTAHPNSLKLARFYKTPIQAAASWLLSPLKGSLCGARGSQVWDGIWLVSCYDLCHATNQPIQTKWF